MHPHSWFTTALLVTAFGVSVAWAIVYLSPSLAIALVAGGFAASLWLQAPALALYGLVATCPFSLSFAVGSIDGVSVKDALLAALGASAVTTIAAGSPRRLRLKTPQAVPILLLWLFLLVWGSITFLLGPVNQWLLGDPIRDTWFVYNDIGRSLIVFPLMLVCLDNRQAVDRAMDLLVIVGALVAANALWLAGGGGGDIMGHFETYNAFAGYLILVIPFAATRLLLGNRWTVRTAHGVALVVMLRGLWSAGSRGGLVAFLSSLLVLALMVPRRWVVAGLAVLVVGLPLLVVLSPDLLDRPMVRRFMEIKNVQEVETFEWRQEQWDMFIQRILLRPWLGTGSDVDPSMLELYRAQTPHNAFLSLSVKSGIPAAAAWALVLLLMLAMGLRRSIVSADKGERAFWIGTLSFLVALTVHNMVESTLILSVTQHMFWIVAACALLRAGPGGTLSPTWTWRTSGIVRSTPVALGANPREPLHDE